MTPRPPTRFSGPAGSLRGPVPDAVVRAADQVELVDMSPQALRRRLAHGNICAPEDVDAALSDYFRIGNLTALRELALLWVADRMDDALEQYRTEHEIQEPWPARDRVVVALGSGRQGDALVRRGARIARRTSGGELLAVHVSRGADVTEGSAEDRGRRGRLGRLVRPGTLHRPSPNTRT